MHPLSTHLLKARTYFQTEIKNTSFEIDNFKTQCNNLFDVYEDLKTLADQCREYHRSSNSHKKTSGTNDGSVDINDNKYDDDNDSRSPHHEKHSSLLPQDSEAHGNENEDDESPNMQMVKTISAAIFEVQERLEQYGKIRLQQLVELKTTSDQLEHAIQDEMLMKQQQLQHQQQSHHQQQLQQHSHHQQQPNHPQQSNAPFQQYTLNENSRTGAITSVVPTQVPHVYPAHPNTLSSPHKPQISHSSSNNTSIAPSQDQQLAQDTSSSSSSSSSLSNEDKKTKELAEKKQKHTFYLVIAAQAIILLVAASILVIVFMSRKNSKDHHTNTYSQSISSSKEMKQKSHDNNFSPPQVTSTS